MNYLYNAAGQKIEKKVHDTQNNTIKQVEYLDGFQFRKLSGAGGVLSSAPAGSFAKIFLKDFLTLRPPTAEGYVAATESTELLNPYIYNYVYNYTDHLGNIRLSYTKDPVTGNLEIMEENHYYPFGLTITEELGVLQSDPDVWFEGDADGALRAEVEDLLARRQAAREAKDWPGADRIRDRLTELNVVVMDGPTGATWRLRG